MTTEEKLANLNQYLSLNGLTQAQASALLTAQDSPYTVFDMADFYVNGDIKKVEELLQMENSILPTVEVTAKRTPAKEQPKKKFYENGWYWAFIILIAVLLFWWFIIKKGKK